MVNSDLISPLSNIGPVHKGVNHVPKAVLDRDLLPDWVHDLNYVLSQPLQTPSQSRTGSVLSEVIFIPPHLYPRIHVVYKGGI